MIAYLVRRMPEGVPVYVGITSKCVDSRWALHKRNAANGRSGALYREMRKIGVEAFVPGVVASARSWEDLCSVEITLIEQHDTYCLRGGCNLTLGGDGAYGNIMSESAKARIGASSRGKKRPAYIAQKTAEKLRGRKLTPEHVAASKAGRRAHFEQYGSPCKGRKMSDENKAKLKEAWVRRREKWPNGQSPNAKPEALAAAGKARWSNPDKAESNARTIARMRAATPAPNEATRRKMSGSAKARMQREDPNLKVERSRKSQETKASASPEVKAARSAARSEMMRLRWAAKKVGGK